MSSDLISTIIDKLLVGFVPILRILGFVRLGLVVWDVSLDELKPYLGVVANDLW